MPPKQLSRILKIWRRVKNKFSEKTTFGKLHIFYRISDSSYDKEKPSYVTNKSCIRNCIEALKTVDFNIIADNVSGETWSWICNEFSHLYKERTSFGNGAASFNHALSSALKLPLDDVVYFIEDDYLHKRNSQNALLEGVKLGADYITLYDHPDKYLDTDNPYVDCDGEITKVFLTESCHWKLTNSTTMTFASKIGTLLHDEMIIRERTKGTHPDDFNMFGDLFDNGRSLISPIPGYSTHGQTDSLSPLTSWGDLT